MRLAFDELPGQNHPMTEFEKMTMPRIPSRLMRIALIAAFAVTTPMIVAVGNITYKVSRLAPDASLFGGAGHMLPLPEHDQTKPTAVVLFSLRATEVTDAVAPFGLIAETGAFNTYALAPVRQPVSVYNAAQRPAGVHVLPHLGYEEYDRLVGRDPDLVVVPYFPGWAPGTDDEVVAWIRAHVGPETRVVTVCAGTEIFAASGLLDGHAATTNPYWMKRLAERHPVVEWLPDHRYVADGHIFTSTSLASGIDATLAALADLLGRDAARDVAARLRYPHAHYLDDSRAPFPSLSWSPLPDMALARSRGVVPVVVDHGVDEIGLSAVLEIEAVPIVSTQVVSVREGMIRTRRGLHMLTAPMQGVVRFHRAVWVAGSDFRPPAAVSAWAERRGGELTTPLRTDLFPYDAVIADVKRRGGELLARGAAANLAYPREPTTARWGDWPSGWWWTLAWALLGAGVAAGALPHRVLTARRTRTGCG